MFLFYRAFQKLWINRKIYFFIMLELAIGIVVVLCGVCSTYSAQSRLDSCKQQIGTGGVVIEYYGNEVVSRTELPISVNDYVMIRDSYDTVEISYLMYANSVYCTQVSLDVKDMAFVCMDKNAFVGFFGFEPQNDTVYIGSQLAEDSENEDLTFFEKWFHWEKYAVEIGELEFSNIMKLEPRVEMFFAGLSVDLDVNTWIIFPEECMGMLQDNADYLRPWLRVLQTTYSSDSDEVTDIIHMLDEAHESYTYRVAEQYLELQKSIIDLTEGIRLFSWIARFALIISMVGIVGVLLIYMEKRKRELAITLALGGTRLTIFKEIFIEVCSLCSISGIIGLVVTIIMVPHLTTNVFTAHFQWICIIVMVGIVLGISIISCTCIVLKIRNIHPMKILKE